VRVRRTLLAQSLRSFRITCPDKAGFHVPQG
jgi:hypothetical protein